MEVANSSVVTKAVESLEVWARRVANLETLSAIEPRVMDPIAMLIRMVVVLVVIGIAYSALLVSTATRLGTHGSWLVWAFTLVVLTGWGVWKMSFFPGVGTGLTVYFFVAFLGIPLAVATWSIQRAYRRRPERSTAARVGWGLGAFFVALPVGFLIAVIPDAMALFN